MAPVVTVGASRSKGIKKNEKVMSARISVLCVYTKVVLAREGPM